MTPPPSPRRTSAEIRQKNPVAKVVVLIVLAVAAFYTAGELHYHKQAMLLLQTICHRHSQINHAPPPTPTTPLKVKEDTYAVLLLAVDTKLQSIATQLAFLLEEEAKILNIIYGSYESISDYYANGKKKDFSELNEVATRYTNIVKNIGTNNSDKQYLLELKKNLEQARKPLIAKNNG